MDYNTQRPQLKISEYGRTIQQMIDYACTIEDKEERTKAAHTLDRKSTRLNSSH